MSVALSLAHRLGGRWSARALHASGFCATWQAQGEHTALFVKSLPADQADMLEAEADGLEALAATGTVRVPAVVGCWRDGESDQALLSLEWLPLAAPDAGFGARLGRALGALHRAVPAEGGSSYGWRRDNRIGATPQANRWSADWIEFYGRQRLAAMRDRLASSELADAVDAVIAALPRFFDDGHAPRPSLIHGDLWSGNWAMLADGSPVVYDPAVSLSDAEAELAMMELFGAPPAGFWPAYREAGGVDAGYAKRRGLYQLYHLLNHAVLFGGGYLRQSLDMARTLAQR